MKTGDLLAGIETPELHQQLKQAEALELQAKANAEIAQITRRRYAGLVRTNAVSQHDVDNSHATLLLRWTREAATCSNASGSRRRCRRVCRARISKSSMGHPDEPASRMTLANS